MQEDVFKTWIGSWSLNWDVIVSIAVPSKVVLLWLHHYFVFVSKSPMATIKKGLVWDIVFTCFYSLLEKVLKASRHWLVV